MFQVEMRTIIKANLWFCILDYKKFLFSEDDGDIGCVEFFTKYPTGRKLSNITNNLCIPDDMSVNEVWVTSHL